MAPTLAALFETMRVHGGRLPFLATHVSRLTTSCPRADLLVPPSDLAERAASHALRAPADRVLRVEWNGATLKWEDRERRDVPPIRLATVARVHPGYPVKSADRVAFDEAAEQAGRAGADEPLLRTSEGWVAETARYAIAWIDGESLRLPDLALEILPSIGRARVLELAAEVGLTPAPGRYGLDALGGKPVFLVNAVRGVVPVASLDGVQTPSHPAVARLAAAFWPSS